MESQGQVVQGIVLHTPVTILYHYQPSELLSLNLDPAHILLSWPTLIAAAQQAKQPTTNLVIAMRDDPTTHTLTAQSSVLGPGPYSLGGDAQNQMAPIPHLAEVQGNNGQLSYSYPLQVVPGSGGFTPQLMLGYSSVGPNDRHNNTSPADDLGDGFSLSLGSITADTYPSGTTWYFLNGIDNVGDRLIQYDSTNKLYYTEHLSYLRIQQTTGAGGQPCFDVWDKAGTFYEVGCTTDSLEYTMSGTTRNNYLWNVDRIIAPNEGAKGSTSNEWRSRLLYIPLLMYKYRYTNIRTIPTCCTYDRTMEYRAGPGTPNSKSTSGYSYQNQLHIRPNCKVRYLDLIKLDYERLP